MRLLIDGDDITRLARPTTADGASTARAVEEAQDLDIKPAIGEPLFMVLDENTQRMTDLLNGCTYTACGGKRECKGLLKALAYYAYSRLVRTVGTGRLTRYALVQKENDWSNQSDQRDRQAAADEAVAIADRYMAEVLEMLRSRAEMYPEFSGCCGGKLRNNRLKIRMIGR